MEIYFLTVLEAWKLVQDQAWTSLSKIRLPAWLGSGKVSLPGWQMTTLPVCPHMAFPWCLHVEKERGKLSGVSSYKRANPTTRAPPSCPHINLITFQSPHFQILSHWGLELPHMNLGGGHTNLQSTTMIMTPLAQTAPLKSRLICHISPITGPKLSSFSLTKPSPSSVFPISVNCILLVPKPCHSP